MSGLQRPNLDYAAGERLTLHEYLQDFRTHAAQVLGQHSWKLERAQEFVELNDASYEAFRRGEWTTALQLLADEAPDLRAQAEGDLRRDSVFHRVRIAAEPITPYLQWEMHAFRVQAENGLPVRVVSAEAISHLEQNDDPLPELVTLGGQVLYRVLYTEQGAPNGALRFTDPAHIEQWQQFIIDLYAIGQDVHIYVQKHIDHLPPPPVAI